jgi:hypothetical protein
MLLKKLRLRENKPRKMLLVKKRRLKTKKRRRKMPRMSSYYSRISMLCKSDCSVKMSQLMT